MATLLADLGVVATEVLDQIPAVVNVIVGQPLLLFTTGFLFIGGVIGILGRLLSRN